MYRMYGIAQGAKEGSAHMYRMYGIAQGAKEGGAHMYRQKFAPAISALPPFMAVVYRGAMDGNGKERCMSRVYPKQIKLLHCSIRIKRLI